MTHGLIAQFRKELRDHREKMMESLLNAKDWESTLSTQQYIHAIKSVERRFNELVARYFKEEEVDE